MSVVVSAEGGSEVWGLWAEAMDVGHSTGSSKRKKTVPSKRELREKKKIEFAYLIPAFF